jgi:hypothetical protein
VRGEKRGRGNWEEGKRMKMNRTLADSRWTGRRKETTTDIDRLIDSEIDNLVDRVKDS